MTALTDDAVVTVLSSTEVFGGLTVDQLGHLAHQCRVRQYSIGEQIFARGDRDGGMFALASGSVALSVSSADGGQVTLAVLGPPRTFGELAVIDGGPRAATATARKASVVVAIPRAEVLRLLHEDTGVAVSLLSALTSVIRQVDDHASDLVLMDLPGRVAKFLAAAAAAQPGPHEPGEPVAVNLALSQSEMARLIGGSRQHVNQAIAALEAKGAIQRAGARIVSISPERLGIDA